MLICRGVVSIPSCLPSDPNVPFMELTIFKGGSTKQKPLLWAKRPSAKSWRYLRRGRFHIAKRACPRAPNQKTYLVGMILWLGYHRIYVNWLKWRGGVLFQGLAVFKVNRVKNSLILESLMQYIYICIYRYNIVVLCLNRENLISWWWNGCPEKHPQEIVRSTNSLLGNQRGRKSQDRNATWDSTFQKWPFGWC